MTEKPMLSIWFFVGLMLTVVGVLVTATGVNYLFHPQSQTVLGHLNPNLWWGAIMLVVGLAFLIPSYRSYKSNQDNRDE